MKKNKYWLIIWLLLSSFVIALLLNLFPSCKWLLGLKDLSIIIFILLNISVIWKTDNNLKYLFFFVFTILGIYFLFSPAPLAGKAASIRQIVIPFLVFIAGTAFATTRVELNILKKKISVATIFLAITGMIIYITHFWDHFSLRAYNEAKNIVTSPKGYSYMFIEPIGTGIPRMVSTILDPINLSHLFAFTLVVGYLEKKLSYPAIAFILVCMIATFGKGGFLQLFLTLLLFFSSRLPWRILIILWLVGIRFFLFALEHHQGVLIHMQGVFMTIKTLTLFGYGMGMVGNQAAMYGDALRNIPVGDTFIGGVIAQIGIIGFLVWMTPFVYFITKLKSDKPLKLLLISQLVVAILSDNSFNLLSILFLMITVGATVNTQFNEARKINIHH